MPKKYTFSLRNIDLDRINQKYGLNIITNKPSTKLDELEKEFKIPETVTFLDVSKKMHRCHVSIIHPNSSRKYNCFWDRCKIPDDWEPLHIPVRFVPDKVIRQYLSEINKENYIIRENITPKMTKGIEQYNSETVMIRIENKGYYETDGVVCSFNCMEAFLNAPENRQNPIYLHSKRLMKQLYRDIFKLDDNQEVPDILPAPHWRILYENGGHIPTIEKYRSSFNKVVYNEHGTISAPIGRLFEDILKF
jgi:hypothetical protein